MTLESTVICVDDSEYMRNGDFSPTRLQAQQDAVGIVCQSKTQSNPENNVGLLTMAGPQVLNTLTTDVAQLLSKLHGVQPKGSINFIRGVRVAHLVLKHRQGKQHRMRIVVFVGSPIETEANDLVTLAKSLKKEKVSVDVVSFGEADANTAKLEQFISTLNGEDRSGGSHLLTVPTGCGSDLSGALVSSPVVQTEDNARAASSASGGFEFGIDPNDDPELVLALRVSMEEQRQRQEEEARRAAADAAARDPTQIPLPTVAEMPAATSEERLLQRALAMSLETHPSPTAAKEAIMGSLPDFAAMTEEEQIAFAMQMSMQPIDTSDDITSSEAAIGEGKVEEPKKEEREKEAKEEHEKKEETEKKEAENKKEGMEEQGEPGNKEEPGNRGKSEEVNK